LARSRAKLVFLERAAIVVVELAESLVGEPLVVPDPVVVGRIQDPQ
jgi:hypothetical protein